MSELGEGPSAQLKPQIDQLVVRCLTTSKSGLCMIFDFLIRWAGSNKKEKWRRKAKKKRRERGKDEEIIHFVIVLAAKLEESSHFFNQIRSNSCRVVRENALAD